MPGRDSCRIYARLLLALLKPCTCARSAAWHGSPSGTSRFQDCASSRQASRSLRMVALTLVATGCAAEAADAAAKAALDALAALAPDATEEATEAATAAGFAVGAPGAVDEYRDSTATVPSPRSASPAATLPPAMAMRCGVQRGRTPSAAAPKTSCAALSTIGTVTMLREVP